MTHIRKTKGGLQPENSRRISGCRRERSDDRKYVCCSQAKRSIARPKLAKLPEKGQVLNLLFIFRVKLCQDRYVFTGGHQARRCCIPLLPKNWDGWRYSVRLQKGPRTAPCGKGTVWVTLGAQATSKITTRKLIHVVVKSFFQSYFTKLFNHTVVMVRITFQSALVSRRRTSTRTNSKANAQSFITSQDVQQQTKTRRSSRAILIYKYMSTGLQKLTK